jgi:glycosyltransferase involved in cell wall biosynthesis
VDGSRIGIVIPAFNESKTIALVVSNVLPFGTPIVVDDGSSDSTGEAAQIAGASVVRHPFNRGYDCALNSGFERAAALDCDYIISIDADGQHDPAILGAFIQALDNGADVVIGIRNHLQRFAEHVFAYAAVRLWGIRDPLCGMKGYRIQIYRELGHFDCYDSIGTELSIYAARRHRRITQIPIKTLPRSDAPRFGNKIRSNARIIRSLVNGMKTRDG